MSYLRLVSRENEYATLEWFCFDIGTLFLTIFSAIIYLYFLFTSLMQFHSLNSSQSINRTLLIFTCVVPNFHITHFQITLSSKITYNRINLPPRFLSWHPLSYFLPLPLIQPFRLEEFSFSLLPDSTQLPFPVFVSTPIFFVLVPLDIFTCKPPFDCSNFNAIAQTESHKVASMFLSCSSKFRMHTSRVCLRSTP